ncbi:type II toxin-antitoxin system RelE/ParE family toxin [Billgrantia ethanolica]|uniref:Type II toxin-antitoxin system RelE/ParE family toxin n=1 Tax=Billgrantia ethanolica TaxID=2733486 RepID=A0ABS9A2Y4_9GAMM|nr:type II toxin-antitoxin system RelE/ParE family toxin [Halomonas ethanolica]MCE8003179.1 type II toxin-antitoxin system RelE/ParE family toxin [Halomonas ethanolica]
MQVLQTPTFTKAVKKLHANQKRDLDKAVRTLVDNPLIGELKRGDLSFLRLYKFKMAKQLALLGYHYDGDSIVLTLMALGTHENFYRDIKR